ncbi:MAG: YitT family protein [Clostridia bacterium]|nr:YitT family protein [Clostridia bacterium]
MTTKLTLREFILITVGSLLYAVSTNLFIFPSGVIIGGTSGISVILTYVLDFSPGTIITVINIALILLAFLLLGKDMAIKTLVGSVLTTIFIGGLEKPLALPSPLIESKLLSALVGAAIIAVASGIMFYVDSSSGGTDIIALIVKKYSRIKIGRALLITDVLIVLGGGLLSGFRILLIFTTGFLVKVLGIDLVILIIEKFLKNKEKNE